MSTKVCKGCGIRRSAAKFTAQAATRDGLRPTCKNCRRAETQAWRSDNRAHVNAQSRRYYLKNPEAKKRRSKSWVERNYARKLAANAERRARERKAIPGWADDDKIRRIYECATRLGKTVDHIVPLVSKIVCGLHCEDNLGLLSSKNNSAKKNLFWPDMP